MKTLIISIFIISLSLPICSQVTLDSSEVTKLIIKLNEREYLLQKDSLTSIELAKKDTIIINQDAIISNLERQVFNADAVIYELKKQISILQDGGLKWYHYTAGGVLITAIGYLLGVLSTK